MSEKNHFHSYLTVGETAAAARLTDPLCLCGAAVKSTQLNSTLRSDGRQIAGQVLINAVTGEVKS